MTRFDFGRNWQSFVSQYSDERRAFAGEQLERLVGPEIQGATFLDIGCGSGLHSLAALDLGAESVIALDIDPESVATARALLQQLAADGSWQVNQSDILALRSEEVESVDIVYAWGVLHHTGDLHQATRQAAQFVKPGGLFVIAIYRKTPFCWFWRAEKRFYVESSRRVKSIIERFYRIALSAMLAIRGTSYRTYSASYAKDRGMSLEHDIRDWLGGYPYQSMSIDEVHDLLDSIGLIHEQTHPASLRLGLLGSACDEYVYRRPEASE